MLLLQYSFTTDSKPDAQVFAGEPVVFSTLGKAINYVIFFFSDKVKNVIIDGHQIQRSLTADHSAEIKLGEVRKKGGTVYSLVKISKVNFDVEYVFQGLDEEEYEDADE